MNISWSRRIFSELYAQGIRDVVVCAGARNSPLVVVLSKSQGFRVHSFFEERSAGFFALGLTRRTGRPSAIVTTSGTAVAELLPAVIEAFHTGFPLVVVSADRPRRLRGTGAPQAIDQTGLFGKFVNQEFDLEGGEMFDLSAWSRRAPVHLNICLDEPLLDDEVREFVLKDQYSAIATAALPFAQSVSAEWAGVRLTKFLRSEGSLAVVVGTLDSKDEADAVEQFLLRLGAPVYLEATSGLRECASLQNFALKSGDRVLAWALKRNLVTKVLRIGGVPTVRIWRDLDDAASSIEVLSLTSLPFAGLSRGELLCSNVTETIAQCAVSQATPSQDLLEKDRAAAAALVKLFEEEPLAEPTLVHRLSRLISENSVVYVGNSLPIREWDLAAEFGRAFHVRANRGVNGIDGQLSTFLGLAEAGRENWALIGDLTAMYDLTAPWALRAREAELKTRFVVLNNGGGKIFNRIFGNALFENAHDLDFEGWARMWRLSYQKWTEVPQAAHGLASAEVIELVPDNEATTRFWSRYDAIWK